VIVMGNFERALALEVQRLRRALARVRDAPGIDHERLRRIASEALEEGQQFTDGEIGSTSS
jgi:hypothetical protein